MYRPQKLSDIVGQENVIRSIDVKIRSAKKRRDALGHVLLEGFAGFGKTTLARAIANEMNTNIFTLNGASTSRKELEKCLKDVCHGDVIFIDEIHRLSKKEQEYLLPIIEDFIDVDKFTLIGATTESGMLLKPFYDRFKSKYQLLAYTVDELYKICANAAVSMFKKNKIDITKNAHYLICQRGRGTPRICLKYLETVRDYAIAYNMSRVESAIAKAALENEGINEDGTDPMDRRYLEVLEKEGEAVGLNRICALTGLSKETITGTIEPYLLSIGKITLTGSGREIIGKGRKEMVDNAMEEFVNMIDQKKEVDYAS